jgi:outer membrane biosynthesis protein TonB
MSRTSMFVVAACAAASLITGCAMGATTTGAATPTAQARDLPIVRAMSPRIATSEPLTADVDVCVGDTGDTQSVRLRHSSGDRTFDTALVADVWAWHYQPNGLARSCRQATVTYVP